MNQKITQIALWTSRILFGFTFLFSGFVKAVDPMGSSYKFVDYFRAFDLTFLNDIAIPLAIILAALEFTIGASILFGSYRKTSAWAALIFMGFFTPLTLYLALKNPVTDCGCFGDALVLSNWETFGKNIVLLLLAIFIFIKREIIRPLFMESLAWIPTFYAFCFSVGISIAGITNLPILDFRPYKVGVNIEEAMQLPEGTSTEYILVYEKEGVKKEFTLDNYPADDNSWTFIESKTVLPKGIKQPAIKDFFLTNENGEIVTQDILLSEGYTFLLLSPDLSIADVNYIDRINETFDYAKENGYHFYLVTANDTQKLHEWSEGTGAEYPVLFSDITIIETIIRSNPGMVLLHEGTILWKKSPKEFPTETELNGPLNLSDLGSEEKINVSNVILSCILIFFAPILVILFFEKTIGRFFDRRKKVISNK